jgi:next-to-BRCA1 protein 1
LSYIEGVRYKCAVCHDTDFCANCEALPGLKHNHTHPLIKFKTPVKNVSVTTLNEGKSGLPITRLGDEPARKSTATETNPVAPSTNAATQVQTIVDMKPTENAQPKTTKEKIEIRDLLSEPIQEKISVNDLLCAPSPAESPKPEPTPTPKKIGSSAGDLDAHFIRDTIPDGTTIGANLNFVQVWTLRNPGPNSWPAGCSVRHVGGDNMLNIDNTRVLSQSELAEASESNVIGRPVEPNEEISFRIMMKAPAREGTAISYWRLKTAEGTPFGHRLWCDIQVVGLASPSTPAAAVQSAPIPVPAPITETAEASSSSSSNMTPHERWQQSKLDRLRSMQRAQAHAFSQFRLSQMEKAREDVTERTSRLQEEAIERLRKMKVHMEEKDSQSRLLEKLEREKLARIQKVRKAAVERLLEARRKEHEASIAGLQEKAADVAKAPEAPVKTETVELPVEAKSVDGQSEAQSSGMIFPRLDKESPASSIHDVVSAKSEVEESKSENTAVAAPESDEEFFEDAESVEIRSFDSDDEGFMTDEEYDILDASDEEIA